MSVTPRALSPASETSDDFASTTVVDSEDGDDHGNGIGNGDEDEAEDGSRIILSPDEVITAWEHAGIDESTQHAFLFLVGHTTRGALNDQSMSMDDLTDLQKWSLDLWTETFGDDESRTDDQADNLGAFQTALFVGSFMTPELLEATECLMVLQKRKGEEARATTAAATTTAAAAETTVAQGEATEAPQQSDQDLEEDDGWQLLMDSLALDD